MAGRQQKMAPTWKKFMELVDLEEPTSFLGRSCQGYTRRECKPNEDIVNVEKMCESRNSATVTEKLPK